MGSGACGVSLDEAAAAVLLDWSVELESSVDELLDLLELDLLELDLLELDLAELDLLVLFVVLAADAVCACLPLEELVVARLNTSAARVSTSAKDSMVTRGEELLRAGCTAGCTVGCGTGLGCIAGAGCGCGAGGVDTWFAAVRCCGA